MKFLDRRKDSGASSLVLAAGFVMAPRSSCGKFLLLYEYRKKQSTANDRPSNIADNPRERMHSNGAGNVQGLVLGVMIFSCSIGCVKVVGFTQYSKADVTGVKYHAFFELYNQFNTPKNDTVLLRTAWFGGLANYPCSSQNFRFGSKARDCYTI